MGHFCHYYILVPLSPYRNREKHVDENGFSENSAGIKVLCMSGQTVGEWQTDKGSAGFWGLTWSGSTVLFSEPIYFLFYFIYLHILSVYGCMDIFGLKPSL